MASLSLRNIYKVYPGKPEDFVAVTDFNLEIEDKEFIVLVGPSGCGKSTLLSILAGLVVPSGGEALVEGRPAARGDAGVGYMLQHDHLFEWRTIEQNVLLGLEVRHALTAESRARAVDLLTTYGLGEFRHATPSHLSGGMRQRAALIRTLAPGPRLLLLDEAFSALDYQTRLSVTSDVHRILRREQATALIVTHDISEAVALSDRVIVLSPRPATVRAEFAIPLADLPPEQRRGHPHFNLCFEQIWKELDSK